MTLVMQEHAAVVASNENILFTFSLLASLDLASQLVSQISQTDQSDQSVRSVIQISQPASQPSSQPARKVSESVSQ